jgi:hypothetical protein
VLLLHHKATPCNRHCKQKNKHGHTPCQDGRGQRDFSLATLPVPYFFTAPHGGWHCCLMGARDVPENCSTAHSGMSMVIGCPVGMRALRACNNCTAIAGSSANRGPTRYPTSDRRAIPRPRTSPSASLHCHSHGGFRQ